MLNMIQSENLKYKRTFTKKLYIFPPYFLYYMPLLQCLLFIQNIITLNIRYSIGGH